jgi:hypothetical protein
MHFKHRFASVSTSPDFVLDLAIGRNWDVTFKTDNAMK